MCTSRQQIATIINALTSKNRLAWFELFIVDPRFHTKCRPTVLKYDKAEWTPPTNLKLGDLGEITRLYGENNLILGYFSYGASTPVNLQVIINNARFCVESCKKYFRKFTRLDLGEWQFCDFSFLRFCFFFFAPVLTGGGSFSSVFLLSKIIVEF